jgi:DNA-binding beta-propeller fold protein YncE
MMIRDLMSAFVVANLAGVSACSKANAPNARPGPSPSQGGAVAAAGPAELTARSVPLPGATGPVTIDYLACSRARARVWVPVGDTGSADVFDIATGTFTRVDGFKTEEREAHGRKRTMGPSAATVGDGFVYVGNRATSEVCAVEEQSLKLGACLKLPTPTDGVVYVASEKEVWVTTPRDHSLTVLDASKPDALKPKLVIKMDGDPEGYAIDARRELFYTNLEDKNRTAAIDIKTHAVKASYGSGCGADGPRGLDVDEARNFVMVACTDGVRVLDGAHDGAPLGMLDTGAGVDNIEYIRGANLLVVAAGKASRLTVARVNDKGEPSVVATGVTAEGARNAVTDADGNIYVVDPHAARLLTFAFKALR